MLQNKKLDDTKEWMDIYASRYSFDFKYLIPDERILVDYENFDDIFLNKESIEKSLAIFDSQTGMYDSRWGIDRLIQEKDPSINLKEIMPEKIEKIKRMDKIIYGLLKRLSARDARFKIFVEDWDNFIKRMDTI